jgi:hypothetical protein
LIKPIADIRIKIKIDVNERNTKKLKTKGEATYIAIDDSDEYLKIIARTNHNARRKKPASGDKVKMIPR